jgi:hypothetical protein
LDPLKKDFQTIVNSVCAPLMERCGYNSDGTIAVW